MSDEEWLVQNDFETRGRFKMAQTTLNTELKEKPATVEVARGGKLKLLCVSDTQFYEQEENNQTFVEFLKSWGGE